MKGCLSVFLVCLFFSCTNKEIVKNQAIGEALGTSYNIIYLMDEEVDYRKEIDSVFAVVNQSLSTYIPTSDISRINKGETTIEVDHMFREVFELSKEIYEATNGYFDPTVGNLVNAWGFGPEDQIVMDSTKVDSLLKYVGFNKVNITNEGIIEKEDSNIYFDFNAIAKGYAIDRVAAMLNDKGIQNFLVEVGGEIVAKGTNVVKNKQWVVGIDDPEATGDRELKLLINLENRALASSGNYRKFRVDSLTGRKFVHTIDPITGYTKDSNTLGVTILAENCAIADAYATAFMAMDLDEAFKLISSNDKLEAYIVYLDDKGETKEFLTSGFKEVVSK
ncbi:thiamine biosynthesis protein ApbE [Maribacter sp. 4U21]|uniref:FAD:protein FMN transferase n=1 Tax=Maribacter sp. 4U21 TaxID=1889779 RepID=UPI000C148022|nr:FAD:protein FMN transferase [Maribacter sp. 4U21]PIB29242.1 thiamine biosynthesis protein ApbE [Maribacter sp. 4U21]